MRKVQTHGAAHQSTISPATYRATPLKFVTQLLERIHSRSPTHRADDASTRNANIASTIRDALATAGLEKTSAQGAQIAGVIDAALARAGLLGADAGSGAQARRADSVGPAAAAPLGDSIEAATSPQGQFLSRTFKSGAGVLAYKLYVPSGYEAAAAAAPLPLLVMLHGCTQSPDDFAAGTRMNALSEQHGFLVAYPAQTAVMNANKCWNWFRPQDQRRDGGEPALISGMTGHIGMDFRVDPSRIFVAGLSAGAAMAVVLGETYPEVFAAVGAHSGLPYRAAHDVGSAFAAMRSGAAGVSGAALHATGRVMPTIVFHGDRDQTVSASNGDAIIAQQIGSSVPASLVQTRHNGVAKGGRHFVQTIYADASGRSVVEDWRVQGGGHAWMGGSKGGTYTDPQGPDASAEMVRFFLQQAV